MSDDRTRPTRARTTGYRPVHLALAATAVAGALAGGGLSLLSSPSTTAVSSAVSPHITKQSTASRLIVSSGFGTPDAVSNGS
ncbi:hypothetical protein [Rhodococcus sp. IEGM 1379]|uniref:hypothetical protein n=1 Tax=Rhodococcus sp. IEGM 1379 TaxID=3047086 RepID=UPI0024B6ACC4|nr:hypothetical protein [Rhodococcus sp. IEGM 1379]MDI9918514.1 hypothetical protein [Rhodococcus sp. IEGM 1379]